MKRILFDCGTRDPIASAALFMLRASFGLMMAIGHGYPKLRDFGSLSKTWLVPDFAPLHWMSSPVSLAATITAEFAAPIFLVLGLATRPAAFLIAFTMTVAAFDVHQSDPVFLGPGVTIAKELALLYLFPMLVLILSGSGAWSMDALVHSEKRRNRW